MEKWEKVAPWRCSCSCSWEDQKKEVQDHFILMPLWLVRDDRRKLF